MVKRKRKEMPMQKQGSKREGDGGGWAYFLTPSQIDEVELAGEFVSSLSVFLLDVDEEEAVAPGAVLVHV